MQENLEIKGVEKMAKKTSSKYRDFILAFSKISISKVCKNCGISRSQIYNNELPEDKERLLQEYIEKEYANLYKNL